MQAAPIDSHLVFDIIYAGLGVGWLVVGLLIKAKLSEQTVTQASDKAELLAHQQTVKDDLSEKHAELIENQHMLRVDFDQKHAENNTKMLVHAAEDTQKFDAISRTLTRMDGKLDKLNGHA